MNIQQAILDMAMKRFEKELKNPNSEVSKKFQGCSIHLQMALLSVTMRQITHLTLQKRRSRLMLL